MTGSRQQAARRMPREVWVLSAVALLVGLGFGVVVPVIPVFARTFGVSATAAGAVIAAFALLRLVSAPLGGRLVNRFDERLVLGAGILTVAVSSVLAGTAQSYAQLLVMRGLGGIGSAVFTVSAASLLVRVTTPEIRGRATGTFGAGFLVGGILGPALGGGLAAVSLRAPFFFYAGLLVVAGAVGLAMLPRRGAAGAAEAAGAQSPDAPSSTTPLRAALGMRAYRAALVASFATGFTLFGVRSSAVPLFVTEELGRPASFVGVGLLVGALATGLVLYPVGRVSDTRGRRPVLVAGAAVTAVGIGLLALTGSPAGFLVAMVVVGLGSGALQVAPGAIMGDSVGRRGGGVVALYQMAGDLGAVVGPLLAGWLVDASGYPPAFLLTAGVLAVAGVAGLLAPETLRREDRSAPLPAAVPARESGAAATAP